MLSYYGAVWTYIEEELEMRGGVCAFALVRRQHYGLEIEIRTPARSNWNSMMHFNNYDNRVNSGDYLDNGVMSVVALIINTQ